MSKSILIVSADLPPLPGRAVTGAGLRMHGIAEGLRKNGHLIKYAISRKRTLQEKELPGYLKEFSYTKSTLAARIKEASPDYILKIWWGEEDSAFSDSPVPVIFDLPAPRLLEDIFHNRSSICNWGSKVDSFKRGTFFTCPSLFHKAYYLPILMMSGFNEKEGLIEVLPHAISPAPEKKQKRDLTFIFGGVFWPWQNPVKGLNTIIRALENRNSGSLKVMTGPLPYNDSEERNYFNPVSRLTGSDRLKISPLLPYAKMKEEFSKALVGVDIMEKNLEREISFSFRTLEYLSCGLPVIVGSSGEWAGWIKEYDAGWVVDPDNSFEIEEVVRDILHCQDIAKERSLNALRLVKEVFNPEKAVKPLDIFLKAPAGKKPAKNSLNALIRLKSSELLADAGFKESAITVLSYENGGSSEWLHHNQGVIFMKMKEFDAALDEFKKEESFFPGKAENFRMSGVACKEKGSYEEAMSLFEKAERVDPFLEWSHLERGLTLSRMGEIERARAEIEKEEELYPCKGETSQAAGIAELQNGERKRALAFFRKAVETAPGLLSAKYNLASLLAAEGDEDEPATLFMEIAADDKSPAVLKAGCCFHIGKIRVKQKRSAEAEKCLRECLRVSPMHREAARLLEKIGGG